MSVVGSCGIWSGSGRFWEDWARENMHEESWLSEGVVDKYVQYCRAFDARMRTRELLDQECGGRGQKRGECYGVG